MPPRHGKSELISHWFPVWYLNQFPENRVILTSYEADFAASWGKKVRDTIEENSSLTVRVMDDARAINNWQTTKGGGMTTAGVGGPITGKGANILIVDDPVKNAEEANSQVYQEKAFEWWRSTAYTRLEPGGAAIIVMTRWNQNDLAGKLIQEMEHGGEKWEVLKLPAIAETDDPLGRTEGEALWPERYNLEALGNIKHSVGSYVWSALYQQSPLPPGGNLFKRQWFEIVEATPEGARKVRYWDLAATEASSSSDPDYTAGCGMARKDGMFYVYGMQRTRSSPLSVGNLVRQTAEVEGRSTHIFMEQEPGASGKNTVAHYSRLLAGFVFRGIKSTGSKVERAMPFAAQAEAGNVKLVNGPWVSAFLDEVEAFPLGAHDDQVDAASGAFNELTSGLGTMTVHKNPFY